jgi:hypothetical protein
VRYGSPDPAPVTTDGPLPETSDLVAGWLRLTHRTPVHTMPARQLPDR